MIADTVISVCALGLTLWGIQATRRQNKLSARPHIVGNQNIDWNEAGCLFTYEVSNHGFGPARLKRFVFILDGQPFSCEKGKHLIEEIFAKKLGGKLEYELLTTGLPNKDYCISPGQSYRIVKILMPGATRNNLERMNVSFKGIDLRLDYESFYGENLLSIQGTKRNNITYANWTR